MTKKATVFIALLYILLFFVWGTAGKPLLSFSIFFPQYHITLVAVFLFLLLLGRESPKFIPIFTKLITNRYIIFPTIGFTIALSINIFAFDSIPHVQDEFHYKYMAETFANGTLAQDMPAHYEFFDYDFFLVDGKRHFSLFMPGFSFFLIPFAILQISFLANPILTAVNILLIGKLARYLFTEETSLYSMFLFVFSPFMMTIGGTWMAHPFTAALTILGVFAFLQSRDTEKVHFPLISGFAIGWLMFSRPQNALFLLVILAFAGLFYFKGKTFTRQLALFSIPLFVWLAIISAYNYNFTENPITFIQDVYFDVSEPINNCHTIGLKRGCVHCNGESLPYGGMTWQRGVSVTTERLVPLAIGTFPHILFFSFSILSLLMTINSRKENCKKIFLSALFLSSIVGYFLFYFNGNVFGPRYLYEGTFFLIILTAAGIDSVSGWLKDRNYNFGKVTVLAFLVGSLLFEIVYTVPNLLAMDQDGFWGVGHLLKEEVEEQGIENSVIFLRSRRREGYGSGLAAMNLGDLERNRNVFVRDLGNESNSKYMHYMKGRDFYRAEYDPPRDRSVRLFKVKPMHSEGFIHIEFEHKFLPYSSGVSSPEYCNKYPVRDYVYPYLQFSEMKNIQFSNHESLYCKFSNEIQSYKFGQHFLKEGVYRATIAAISGPVFGDLDIFMDDSKVAAIEIGESTVNVLKRFEFQFSVSEGLHTFRIAPQPNSLPERNYFMLDYVRFEQLSAEK